jgi:hypothetical protein
MGPIISLDGPGTSTSIDNEASLAKCADAAYIGTVRAPLCTCSTVFVCLC